MYFIFEWRHQILYFHHQVPCFQPNPALQMNILLTWFDDPPMTRNGVGKNRDTSSAFKVACWEISVYKFNPRAARSVHSEWDSTLLSPDFCLFWTSFPWSSSKPESWVIQWAFEPSWKASVGGGKRGVGKRKNKVRKKKRVENKVRTTVDNFWTVYLTLATYSWVPWDTHIFFQLVTFYLFIGGVCCFVLFFAVICDFLDIILPNPK